MSSNVIHAQELFRMRKYGARFPETIDIVAHKNNICTLYIVQQSPINSELLLGLEKKLNNYLTYALDGQLYKKHPDLKEMPVRIHIDFKNELNTSTETFIKNVRPIIESEGIELRTTIGMFEDEPQAI